MARRRYSERKSADMVFGGGALSSQGRVPMHVQQGVSLDTLGPVIGPIPSQETLRELEMGPAVRGPQERGHRLVGMCQVG